MPRRKNDPKATKSDSEFKGFGNIPSMISLTKEEIAWLYNLVELRNIDSDEDREIKKSILKKLG